MKEITTKQINGSKKIGIVVADFNSIVTNALLNGAVQKLQESAVTSEQIIVVHVPGALELARVVNKLSKSGLVDGIIALGAVIKGETNHYDYVCKETAAGLSQVSLQGAVPVMFGVLTTESLAQAIDRAGGKSGNKGTECAAGIVQMLSVEAQIDELV
ncbi:6,7-dimethyl-8-ribityllumazine synthase [Companilactobacillus heilongjiangensis]|uniref:6,7-dimethyl-8-ribityllumazine synthase n=1 Tax=Companilactobacillus heilongjiangensis TaxID=1074467 RepID=A0A0K2LCP2_9LACO|nr:6,7-dimethyl-8-ribityllumazine synthase [Companilactobacillus heilongjiangensis]ALB28968.1 6,7-dimethyl-8-ribityllumazine synthase [Companilactobacillus heilongjiangensis]